MVKRKVEINPLLWLGLSVLVILLGLCTLFALLTTGAQAWQEHAEQRWPVVTTHVDKCDLQRSSTNGGSKVYIRCRLSYAVGTELNVTNIYSASVAAPEVWQYPRNQIAPLEEWLEANPRAREERLRGGVRPDHLRDAEHAGVTGDGGTGRGFS